MARRVAMVIAGAAFVVGAAGFLMTFGVGPSGTTPVTDAPGAVVLASPSSSDLPLVAVSPAPSPVVAGSAIASPAATAAAGQGVRADRIKITRLGIDLAIVEGDGLDAPIGKAAHYPGSAWPDGGSNIYIYGHARVGMFLSLWKVNVGDTVELDLVDGTSRTYVVTKVLPKVPYDAVTYLAPTPTEQLTLQTSTSYYPTAPRFVVIAVPKS